MTRSHHPPSQAPFQKGSSNISTLKLDPNKMTLGRKTCMFHFTFTIKRKGACIHVLFVPLCFIPNKDS